jgi:hypothetical protein
MTRNATFMLAVLLCLVPFVSLGCRSTETAAKWTIEDAAGNEDGPDSHPEFMVSLALDSQGRPQIMYGMYHGRSLREHPGMGSIRWAFRDSGTNPPRWVSEEVARVEDGGWAEFCFDIDDHDTPVYCLARTTYDHGDIILAAREEGKWTSLPIPANTPDFYGAIGNLYDVVWYSYDWNAPFESAEMKHASDTFGQWQVETFDKTNNRGYVRMAVDMRGNVHVVYGGNDDLRYAVCDKKGWRIETIEAPLQGAPFLAIAADKDCNPHVAYTDQRGKVFYARRNANGWQRETLGPGAQPAIDVDKFSGTPYVTFVRDGALILARRADGKWIEETIDTHVAGKSWTCVKLHYDGSAPASIGIAWQSGLDNSIKFASAQFPKRK